MGGSAMYGEDRHPRRLPCDSLQNAGRFIRAQGGALNTVKTHPPSGFVCFAPVRVSLITARSDANR